MVFDFPYTFAICAWSGFDPELDRSEVLAKEIVDFKTFWSIAVLLGIQGLWFALYFCNFDLDPELIRIRFRMWIFSIFL